MCVRPDRFDDNVKVPGLDQGADRVAQGCEFALVRADEEPAVQTKHTDGTRDRSEMSMMPDQRRRAGSRNSFVAVIDLTVAYNPANQ